MESVSSVDEINEYDALITRNSSHSRILDEEKQKTAVIRKSERGKKFIPCNIHVNNKQVFMSCSDCLIIPSEFTLPNGKLPSNGQVLAYYFAVNQMNPAQSNFDNVCLDIMIHWISCNVYTVSRRTVRTKLDELVKKYRDLNKIQKVRRNDNYYTKLKNFKSICESIFDIKCLDVDRKKRQEDLWGVKETADDLQFYQNQLEGKVCSAIFISNKSYLLLLYFLTPNRSLRQ